jgi:hypothetical protein
VPDSLGSWMNLTVNRPIQTYQNRGVAKPGIVKWHHAIIYTGRNAPACTSNEKPRGDDDEMLEPPIRVRPSSRGDKLLEMSRINFGKMHTVEHNVKVLEFGRVHESHRRQLVDHWRYVLALDVNRRQTEQDEEEENDNESSDGENEVGEGYDDTHQEFQSR